MDKALRARLGGGLLGGMIVLVGGTVAASADAPNTTINACVANGTGSVRIIDPAQGQTCFGGNFDHPVSWNQTGPQGLPGENGAPGAPGPKGDKGDPGTSGVTGYTIVKGPLVISEDRTFSMSADANCGQDKVVVGGGYQKIGRVDINLMIPVDFGGGRLLHVSADTDGTANNSLQVYAFCVNG